jgi:hypothetical protein
MKTFKLALIGTAAIAALSVSARADSLDALKSQIDSLQLAAVADAPAAPATTVVWHGRVRAGIIAVHTVSGTNVSDFVDIRTNTHIDVTGTTQTAVGEVGVTVGIQTYDSWLGKAAHSNTKGVYNAGNPVLKTDGFSGWWKMTPNLTLKAGQLGVLNSSYSMDALAPAWFAWGSTHGIQSQNWGGDPSSFQLAYADGPLGFALQVSDGNYYSNNQSAFGASAKASYKMDAFGLDVSGHYWGNANPNHTTGYGVAVGAGYSAGAFSLNGSIGTGQRLDTTLATAVTDTWGSLYASFKLSDAASIDVGIDHNFGGYTTEGNRTYAGVGIYYSPASQITIGAEASYVWDNAPTKFTQSGTMAAGLVTQFSF